MPYEIHAVRYAHQEDRRRHQNFVTTDDPHGHMPMDFYVWAIVGEGRTIVVDTGFGEEEAERRGREIVHTPADALARIGVIAERVSDVVLTHLHYDHAGTTSDFPNARFHLQDLEMAFATGRHMTEPALGHAYTVDHIVDAVRLVYGDRMVFHDGDAELAPGIVLHLIGGHAKGLMAVSVETDRGTVVLASDAAHYYENLDARAPFPIVADMVDMVKGWDRLYELAHSPDHIIPGHDPAVLARFPASVDGFADAARVDLEPIR